MTVLRIASYNVHHGADGADQLDLPRTAATLAALDAEVIGLQEVDVGFGDRSGHEDQAARLAELLGYEARFAATIDRPADDGARARYGLALLTRGAILEHWTEILPGASHLAAPHETRGLLGARVRTPGPELTVLVTHLDHAHRDHRAAQVRGILHRTAALDGPRVLLGDLNADPLAPELAPLAEAGWREALAETTGRGARSPLTSALAAALPVGPSASQATFPARWPLRRLDSIWVRGALEVTDLEVPRSRASDHRPTVATIRLPSIVGS
ncbi:endonuclease/exonuclease/phosphatase family protein [Brachybacterium sacelli]|uniref:Endonuclease/exonuclease/phosphatase family metal-dependent hydrolase n=1 Tax=Brachybacterium sacelli TaxID=173364 RepID=A0ABS4X387_9MICO|nr:endonuclease/exonuclease/phosphatase family protein [Brachybacterium sacelli]MBP2382209.1 endonuclease/exonuclease/phosphatase family metal-dependent hydrolase [Brachybacterium sacelli]